MDDSSPEAWLRTRQTLLAHRLELTDVAAAFYPDHQLVEDTDLLTRAAWILREPVDIEDIELGWADDPGTQIDGRGALTEAVRAIDESGHRFESYAQTMAVLARPRIFDDRPIYRLVSAELSHSQSLCFVPGRYFDGVNVGEAAAHEFAAKWVPGQQSAVGANLPLRSAVADPCDLRQRPAALAITTLTLRHDRRRDQTTCVLHWRDPTRVAHAGGLYQVMPVGVFQPLAESPAAQANDFDLWRTMIREYHEELLGGAEEYPTSDGLLDYADWPFYAKLTSAREAGQVRTWCLGMGVDPLTLAVDLLTVAVFDADVFDSVFDGLVQVNDEGKALPDVPFHLDALEPFLTGARPMQPAGVAALKLAWRHRDALLEPGI